MKTKETWQDRNRKRTAEKDKAALARGVEIFVTRAERDADRADRFGVFYSGADDFVMHTCGDYLALAVAELARIRNRKKVTVRVTRNGFQVSTKPRKVRKLKPSTLERTK